VAEPLLPVPKSFNPYSWPSASSDDSLEYKFSDEGWNLKPVIAKNSLCNKIIKLKIAISNLKKTITLITYNVPSSRQS
jgi:hypothetical protein